MFDQEELGKFLNAARKAHHRVMEKFDSLPQFSFGPCPLAILGDTSDKAVHINTDIRQYFDQVSITNPNEICGKALCF